MRKRVLYLHGLESSNTGSKVDFLHEVSDCFAPAMDYKDIHVEKHLMKMVQAFKPDVIIGSSMGGHAALLLGNYFNIPVVAFNPAIHSRSIEPKLDRLEAREPNFNFQPVVILGLEDDVINPLITKEILDDALFYCDIEEIEGMGHRIPLIDFEHIYNKYIA